MQASIVLLLAAVASAQQVAITDLIGKQPTQQVAVTTPAANTGLVASSDASAGPAATSGMVALPYVGNAQAPVTARDGVNHALGGAAPSNSAIAVNPTFANGANPIASMLSGHGANGANPMASMLTAMAGAAGNPAMSSQSQGANPYSGAALSQESTAVVSGLVEAFMHKVILAPGERQCLESNIGQFTGDVMGTVGDIVTAVKALVQGKGHVAKEATGGLVSAGIDSAMKITSLVGLSTQLIKNCVHGDALALLKTCSHHLINATYLEHTFIANGVDIAHDLSDSILAFEKKDYHRFGADIGVSLRKLVLSNATNATRLPEGMPEEVIIQKATDGLMRGFFVSGSSVEITDTAHPDIDVKINLHQCIAGNSDFFKELWMSAWDLIAQLSVNSQQHGLAGAFQGLGQSSQGGGQPKWSGELMVAMMQFPSALMKCGLSQDMQTTFMEAIKTLGDLHVSFHIPHDSYKGDANEAEEVAKNMAKAVEAWTNWDFEKFGFELGDLFRNLVMLAFPEKYSVDSAGRLRRYSQSQVMTADSKTGSVSAAMVIIGGVSVLAAFAVVRTRRSVSKLQLDRQLVLDRLPVPDIEDGEGAQLVE